MARSSKGVITLRVSYRPDGPAWRLNALEASARSDGEADCAAAGECDYGLIHDLLDHWIPGFPPNLPRTEAKALLQYAARTGSDPLPALTTIVDRDLLAGCCRGEPLIALLPSDLLEYLPASHLGDAEAMQLLRERLGDGLVRSRLITCLVELGWAGMPPARATWIGRGLDYRRRQNVAAALERLLVGMEEAVHSEGWPQAHGELAVANDMVRFRFDRPGRWEWAREVLPA